jgi:hypothetical protein
MAITNDDFEYWVRDMDDRLSLLMDKLRREVSENLNYSPGSVTILERWLLSKYQLVEDILKESQKQTLDQLSIYLGETFRKNVGGKWNIDLKNSKNVYFSIPVVQRKGKWTDAL